MTETILVVDDTTENVLLVSEALNDLYTVIVAKSGEKALEIADGSTKIDLILLDIEMPGMDGYDVCKLLKENKETCEIPIIFLTAKTHEKDEQIGFDLGAVDYISKPISVARLKARIKNHLQLQNALYRLKDINESLKDKNESLKDKNEYLKEKGKSQFQDINRIQYVILLALTAMVLISFTFLFKSLY